MDLSQLSTDDLKALQAGDMSKVSTEGLKMLTAAPPANSNAAPAPMAPPAASPAPQAASEAPAAPAYQPQHVPMALGEAANAAQGATFGTADEIGANVAKPITYALKNLLPQGMGGEDVTYDQVSHQLDQIRSNKMSDLSAWNEQNPVDAFASQMVGGAAMMGGPGALYDAAGEGLSMAASKIPFIGKNIVKYVGKAESAISKYLTDAIEANPYKAAAGIGAAQGGVYGAGATNDGDRTKGAIVGGAGGAVLGPSFKFVGDNVVSPLLKKGGDALQNFLKSSEESVATGAEEAAPNVAENATAKPEQPAPAPEVSNITNEPMTAAPVTGKLPLSPGVAAKDPNLLRVEENARQGLLGQDAQAQMNKSDADIVQGAKTAMQTLKGVTNKDSDSLLSDAVKTFQTQANTVKAQAQDLYTQRDNAMADAVLNKNKVGPSLGGALNDVINEPKNVAGFKSKSGAPAKALYQDFKDLITGTKGKELPFSDLAAWRSDVASLATTDQSTAGTMAKRLGAAYDNWMDNITQDHFISGDPNAASLARQASSAWKNYKNLFGSENSPVIAGMVKPYDAVPADFVDKVFGSNIAGNGNTALNMRKMAAALPENMQQKFKDNVFSGLVSKVFEGANGDNLQLGKLRDNLTKLQGSQVYKEQFAGDASKHNVITNLINDLTQHIQQTGRRDVYSPSGGAVIRGMKKLIGGAAETPIVNKIPGVKLTDTIVNKAGDMSQQSMDRATFNAAMKSTAQAAHAAARAAPVFDLNALKAGVSGGLAAGSVVQINSREKKK